MFNYNKINILVSELQQKKKSVTIQNIADKVGMSKTMFDDIRNGRSKPTAEKLESIALFFGKDMNFFFDTMVSIDVHKTEPIKMTEGNDYILRRFEELVAENALLKKQLDDYSSNCEKGYTLPDVPVIKAAEPAPELKK